MPFQKKCCPFSALLAVGVMLLAGAFTACGGRETAPADGVTRLSVWAHTGQEAERDALAAFVDRFNASQNEVQVAITFLPDGAYNAQVQSAALANDLPDVLEFDGPFLYNYAWQGHLRPLDDLIPVDLRGRLIPSIIEQGTFAGNLYSIGMYDSGLGLFGRRSMLEAAGIRIPASAEDAWSVDEFEAALETLAAASPSGHALDLKLNYTGEWYAYAFSPAIQSGGGDLINRQDYQSADGVLNGSAAVAVMTRFQSWLEGGLVDPNTDDNAFVGGRVALSWVGHWEYPRYAAAHGDDLVVMPLPDFGNGTRTGQGSWNWGITRSCANPEAAMQFLGFLLGDAQVIEMTAGNAAVPATKSAAASSELYAESGSLRLFLDQLTGGFGVPRPRTPAYGVITAAFEQAFDDIRNGAPVQDALDRAVVAIDRDIADNEGYPVTP